MHLFVLITGIVLFPKVYALKCNGCTGQLKDQCIHAETECPAGSYRCVSLRMTTYEGNRKLPDVNDAGCRPASHCVEGSMNNGEHRTVFSGKCCTTDLCNNQPPPEPAAPRPNGKTCIGCDGTKDCRKVNCVDNEDSCYSTVDGGLQNMTLKGCISKDFCLTTGISELLGIISAKIICCQGDYCNNAGGNSAFGISAFGNSAFGISTFGNSAGSTGGSLLLLVVTVVSLVIFLK